ncbi:MAG: molybdate ABC transporter substrate-binding protein [Sulfurimonas sp.]|nr:MAG: molybdate ABC transporter substrate-binding protein [Sulfurimonas sp.]
MLKKLFLYSLIISTSLYGTSINVAVAANVSYAIDKLKKEFKLLHPNTRVKIILASSGALTAQIKHGAPYQIFMSANMKYPEALYSDKIAITKPLIYAKGSLAYFSTKKLNYSLGMNLLKEDSISKIAIANPKTAPYGKAAYEAIKKFGILDEVKNKFVYAQSISQTVSYIITATDIGFIAKSSLYSPHMKKYKKDINWIDVDTKLYKTINQGIVILNNAKDNNDAKKFYDFILSDKAKKIFKDFGYIVE